MSIVAARHIGLPFVPKPWPNELLGSWLLRIAQLYGLGLATLLSRLGAHPQGETRLAHWFAIDRSSVDLNALSTATHMPRSELDAMAPPHYRSRWPEELGACARCLAGDAGTGQPTAWDRRWINPLAIVCDIHGTWLTPVATQALARVRHAGHVETLAQELALLGRAADGDICLRDALWLQRLCFAPTIVRMSWGKTNTHRLTRIVDAVAREVIAASARHPDTDARPNSVKSLAFEHDRGVSVCVSLPTQLRQRQSTTALVAHVLRCPAEQRTCVLPWPPTSVKRLAATRDWPRGALAWISPEAAELVERQEALRQQFSISPRYFKACAALLSAID